MTTCFEPWPVDALRDRLRTGRTLFELCSSRVAKGTFDVREHLLEDLTRDVIRDHLAFDRLSERTELRRTLGLATDAFPARSRPDIVIQLGESFHILEVKSSKVDDSRPHCVLGKPFRAFLESRGHACPDPWEVEQDSDVIEVVGQASVCHRACASASTRKRTLTGRSRGTRMSTRTPRSSSSSTWSPPRSKSVVCGRGSTSKSRSLPSWSLARAVEPNTRGLATR
jgi:hypothetical protein